jgi:hypothetical protein
MSRAKNAQIPCELLYDERLNGLKLTDQAVYLKLFILAVHERAACLTGEIYGFRYLAHTLHIDIRTLRNALARIAAKKLIAVFEDQTVIVFGVKELHKRLDWKPIPKKYFEALALAS